MATPAAEILSKTPLPTMMDTEEIRVFMSEEIRRRSFFSARTTSLTYLKALQRVCAAYADGRINAADARLRCLQTLAGLGFDVEGAGGLRDPASTRRLELIIETQRKMAASVARLQTQTPDEREAWPAWRLERYGTRREPREDWPARWYRAGQAVGWEGALRSQMVALKTSPIWQALGNGEGGFRDTLGNPFPPFAFGSGLEWTDVSAEEAERLGLPRYQLTEAERVSLAPSDREIQAAVASTGLTAEELVATNRAGEHCPDCGRWLTGDGVCTYCLGAEGAERKGWNPDAPSVKAAEVAKGAAAIRKCMAEKSDALDVMARGDLGVISFIYGDQFRKDKGYGLFHAQYKHGDDPIEMLARTLIYGQLGGTFEQGRKRNITYGNYVATLKVVYGTKSKNEKGPDLRGIRNWVVTSFDQRETQKEEGSP